MGSPAERASLLVRPPGLPTIRSAAAIHACISEVKPITRMSLRAASGTIACRRLRACSLWPQIATTVATSRSS